MNAGYLEVEGDLISGEFRTDNVFHLGGNSEPRSKSQIHFLSIRALIVALVRDRSRPMWQRLLLTASLCKRLDQFTIDGKQECIWELLETYEQVLGQGPYSELEKLASDVETRLEIVIALSDERSRDVACGQRFRDTFWTFIEGVGSLDSSGPTDDIDRFRSAEGTYFRSFFERSPFIFENYLLNYIFQHLFPYGRSGSGDFVARTMFDECILLVAQFAWVTSLLIGIAGHYKESFDEEHVVSAIQSFTRAVEHVPQVLQEVIDTVKLRELDNLQGLAVLLRT